MRPTIDSISAAIFWAPSTPSSRATRARRVSHMCSDVPSNRSKIPTRSWSSDPNSSVSGNSSGRSMSDTRGRIRSALGASLFTTVYAISALARGSARAMARATSLIA
jgi:hypothetical protein